MKKNELKEIKKLDIKGLTATLKSLRSEIIDLTISKSIGKLANLKQIKGKKIEIAQVLTIMQQKNQLDKLEKQNG